MTEQLGVSKIDDRNRTYIPESVIKILKINGGNNWLSWEIDETGQIFVLKGHLRFLRKKNYQPKEEKMGNPPEGGEETQTQGGNTNGDMANKTTPKPNPERLDDAQKKSYTPAQTGT